MSLNNPIQFIKAGKAIFTVRNDKTGNRYTFLVRKAENADIWFVNVLSGPDNENSYNYLGCIFNNDNFVLTKKSRFNDKCIQFRVFSWLWSALKNDLLPECVKIFHEGRCGRCGRVLTVPESIESGFGPECISKVGL